MQSEVPIFLVQFSILEKQKMSYQAKTSPSAWLLLQHGLGAPEIVCKQKKVLMKFWLFPHTHIIPYQQVKPPELKSRLDPLIRRLCQPGLTNPGLTKRVRSHPLKQNILPRQNIETKILKQLQTVLTIIIGYL